MYNNTTQMYDRIQRTRNRVKYYLKVFRTNESNTYEIYYPEYEFERL